MKWKMNILWAIISWVNCCLDKDKIFLTKYVIKLISSF